MDLGKGLSDFGKGFSCGARAYFIGIKGTGMCALAELMHSSGVSVSGSDVNEVFYTDAVLKSLGIPFYEGFDASHISKNAPFDLIVYSAAYTPDTNPEVAAAAASGLTMGKYSDVLGAYSALFDSSGIAGVHGKTTTTALAAFLARGAGLPARVLVGSAVNFSEDAQGGAGQGALVLGGRYFIAETCEYRRHFLSFHPQRILLTSIESDHQDFFPDYESIRDAFLDYCRLLPPGGELIYCADDAGASEAAGILKKEKPELIFTPYGFEADGDYGINFYEAKDERIAVKLNGFSETLSMRIPGRHTARNAAGAMALISSLVQKEFSGWTNERLKNTVAALEQFRGSRRRSEILGEACGILFMDDYGHHPTAIKTTLEGLKEFYPSRRIVLSFMSHTYTRTASLLEEFAASFEKADVVILHKVYSSAREKYSGGVTGRTLFERTEERMGNRVSYVEEVLGAVDQLKTELRSGDLFITMGAGDNFRLSRELFDFFKEVNCKTSVLSDRVLQGA
ncbi:MAG: UDP-N-acetylmuramate--L-alanine ligase [Treponema sp.]|jgi:UDP-N-acetylmuramate--alanine ligase|nr:UDP-N-acetylmuramate--L-alanine ligase [Treponema sp.]